MYYIFILILFLSPLVPLTIHGLFFKFLSLLHEWFSESTWAHCCGRQPLAMAGRRLELSSPVAFGPHFTFFFFFPSLIMFVRCLIVMYDEEKGCGKIGSFFFFFSYMAFENNKHLSMGLCGELRKYGIKEKSPLIVFSMVIFEKKILWQFFKKKIVAFFEFKNHHWRVLIFLKKIL